MSTRIIYNEMQLIHYGANNAGYSEIQKYIKHISLTKEGAEQPALLTVIFADAYKIMADNLHDGDYVKWVINDSVEFEGLIMAISESSSISPSGDVQQVSTFRAVDLTIMLQKFGQVILDETLVNNKGAFYQSFLTARSQLMKVTASRGENIVSYMRKALDIVLTAWTSCLASVGLPPTTLRTGETLQMKWGQLFRYSDTSLKLAYPTDIAQVWNVTAVWDLWKSFLPVGFYELISDTYSTRNYIQRAGVTQPVAVDGHAIVIRENIWLDFDKYSYIEIDPAKIVSVQLTRSANERRGMYMVVPMFGNVMEAVVKMGGVYALDKDTLSLWGLQTYQTQLYYYAPPSKNAPRSGLQDLQVMCDRLLAAYKDIGNYYSGSISGKFISVKVGNKVRFPRRVSVVNTENIDAVVAGYTHEYIAGNEPRLSSTISIQRGQSASSAAVLGGVA